MRFGFVDSQRPLRPTTEALDGCIIDIADSMLKNDRGSAGELFLPHSRSFRYSIQKVDLFPDRLIVGRIDDSLCKRSSGRVVLKMHVRHQKLLHENDLLDGTACVVGEALELLVLGVKRIGLLSCLHRAAIVMEPNISLMLTFHNRKTMFVALLGMNGQYDLHRGQSQYFSRLCDAATNSTPDLAERPDT